MKKINSIIFDLGGVILNIDYAITINKFKNLGIKDAKSFYSKNYQKKIFDQLETGNLSSYDFLENIKKICNNKKITSKKIKNAWCSMILDLPDKRLQIIQKLKQKYSIFLLSNTNAIHINFFKKSLTKEKWNKFNNLFNKIYYSHEIKIRKPSEKAFQLILQENNLRPKEVLFIDDSIQHIKTAKELGINYHHLKENEDISTLFFDKALLKHH